MEVPGNVPSRTRKRPRSDQPAQRERARFDAAYQTLLHEVHEVSLSILIWGPTRRSSSTVATKRREIQRALKRLGHNAMFSEDLPIQMSNISEKSREFAQARAADLIIILMEDSPGALAEAHDFCNHPDIAPNVYVMVPKRYRSGYSGRGAIKDLDDGYGGVYWYSGKELASCNVRDRVVKRAEARRCIQLRMEVTRG